MKHPIICIYGIDEFPKDKFPSQDTMTIIPKCNSETDLFKIQPDIIVTIGSLETFSFLSNKNVSFKWLHVGSIEKINFNSIMYCYVSNIAKGFLTNPTLKENTPLISIYTSSYKSSHKIKRPFRSLQAQSYPYWEWIIINDSPEDEANCLLLKNIESQDARIRVYSGTHNIANIGQHKFAGSMLSRGKYLVELDHDDDLTPDCLEIVHKAFEKYPEAGFAYTDFAELHEKDLSPFKYGAWAYNFGAYYTQMTRIPGIDKQVLTWIAASVNINNFTIRNIVGVPNHIRVWRKDLYQELGGHSPLPVGDDYELLVRTFLKTRFVKIPQLGYYQYRNESGNTTFQRNELITLTQNVVRQVYESKIQERLIELGCASQNDGYTTDLPVWEQDIKEVHCTLVYKKEGKTIVITNNYEENISKAILEKDVEIVVVGYNSEFLDEIIQYIYDDRVRWWNLQKEYNDGGIVAKRYADLIMVRTQDVEYL